MKDDSVINLFLLMYHDPFVHNRRNTRMIKITTP